MSDREHNYNLTMKILYQFLEFVQEGHKLNEAALKIVINRLRRNEALMDINKCISDLEKIMSD